MGREPRVDARKRIDKSFRKVSRTEMFRRRVGVTVSLRICSIARRMKRDREQRQRLGGEALGRNRGGSSHPATGMDVWRKSLEIQILKNAGCWCARPVCGHDARKSGAAWKSPSRITSGRRT